jgi:hypothetical protein
VFGFGLSAHSPSFRISRRTRRRPIESPSATVPDVWTASGENKLRLVAG